MKIAWLLVWTWASSDAQLRFATEESLDEIQEDETHKLTPVQLETSPGVPLIDGGATWSQTYYQLLISCEHGTLQLDRQVEHILVDTTFLCVSRAGDPQQKRSIGVLTTAQEAQQILSSIVYHPDLNYHSTWYGVTDPFCSTGHDGNEIVRMQLSSVNGDLPEPSEDTCVTIDLGANTDFEAYSTHEKKISVSSVNDPPSIERELGQNLSVVSGGSCIRLYGFKLGDAEADAIQDGSNTMVPTLSLQLSTNFGLLRVNRRSALQSGILVIGNGKTTTDATFAWKTPDLFDSTLMMKGAISDLNEFLPEVEYCSSTDFSVVAPDTLRVTLSDNGFCGSLTKVSLSASLVVPVWILPTSDLEDLLVTKTNITLTTHLASVLSMDLVADSTAPLSKTLFQSSLVNPGSETQIVMDTNTMVLKTLDTSTIVASGAIQTRVPRMVKKLGIRLPLSYLQVDLNQTVTIDGVGFDGYAPKLNFTVSCTKGTINLLHKQPAPTLLSYPVNSTLKINGYFSTLEETLQNTHLVYSPLANATGYDILVFTIESIDDQATEILSIVINSPVNPPALILPASPIYAFKNEYVPVAGVTLNIADVPKRGVTSRGITVDIASRSGQVELATDYAGHNPQRNAGVQIQGDSENINAALKGLIYKPRITDTPTEDQILFATSWTAESGGVTSTATFVVPVNIIRRPPAINIIFAGKVVGDGSVVTTTMNTPVSLESLLIQVDDGDDQWKQCIEAGINGNSCNVTIQLSLFAGHGIISNHTNQFPQGREQDSPLSLVRFSGSVAQANNFLQQQVYIPDDKFFGSDHVVITIKHSASATDEDAIAEDTTLLPVFVAPGCDPPKLFWADSGTDTMSVSFSSRVPCTLPEIMLVREGLEKGLCQDDIVFRATVEADQGFLTLKSSSTTIFSDDPRILILEGRIWDLNLAFKSVEYQFEIHRDTQILVRANIEVHAEEKTRQKNDAASSAYLRLKFTGDIQLQDLLAKVGVVGSEDTDMLIGDAINLDALMDLAGDATITINVHNGVVYASADGINMKANSEHQVDTNDNRQLRSVMTNLRYIPNPNFNGIDEIDFRTGNQHSILYIYVEAKNDPPELTFNSEEMTYGVNDTITDQLEMFDDRMRLMTNEDISVKVTEIRPPKRFNSLRTTEDGQWNVSLGYYTNLTSLLNVSILADTDSTHENELDEDILELNVSCSNCQWRYQAYIPRVSYEFAQIPSSRLRFLGLNDSLNAVLATLELAITSTSSSNAETIHFQLAPYSVRRTHSLWMDSTNVSIPFTIQASSFVWEAQRVSFIVQSPNFTASLTGVELRGKEENPSVNLTIRFECTLGEATISMKPTFLGHPCGSGESALSFTMERSHVNEAISSTFVKVMIPKDRESRVELRLSVIEPVEDILSDAASIELYFRSLRQLPMATLAPGNISVTLQVNEEELQPVGDVLVGRGDLDDTTWFRMKVSVAHGRLTIPNNVCCVDIRETVHENELDVVGPALALKNALAAAQLQGGQPNVSFSIPVEVVSVHEPTISNQRGADSPSSDVITSGTTITFESDDVDIDLLRGFASVKMCENPDLAINLAMTQRENIDDFKAVPMIPLIHIEGSIEGPLSSKNWEVISLTLEIGKSWNIPGIFIGDCNGQSIVSDDDLTLDISAGIGSVLLTVWDGLQIANGQDNTLTSITAVGKMDRLNAALLTLRYQCSGSCSSNDEIILRVTNPAVRPPASHQRTIRIDQLYIVPVPRVVTSVSLYYSTEDASFQFSDLTLNFADNGDNGSLNNAQAIYDENAPIYRLEIRVSYGTIAIITTDSFAEVEQQVRNSATSHLELEDTVINLERGLDRLVYFSPQNWNEEQFPGGHIVEWQFVVSYENKSVESFADLVVTSRVDAPVISVPQVLEDPSHYMSDYLSKLRFECLPLVCDEDTPMLLDGFSVRAADTTPNQLSTNDLLLASLSASHGIISFGDNWRTNCISQFVGSQSWKRVSFIANADCINRVLTGMVYVGEPNFSGADQLKIRVEYARELDAAFDEAIVPVIVVELNDAPYIEVDSVFYEAEEDIPLVIDNLRLRDPETLDAPLRVVMDASYGQLALLKPNGVKVTTETVNSASRLTLEGTLYNLDIAIASVVYTSAQDWNSLQIQLDGGMNGFDTITIYSTDFSTFNGSSVSVLFIYVEPTPDPVLIDIPSNSVMSTYADDPPGTLRGDEDTWISVKSLAFSSADDTSRTTLVVSFSVTNGMLSLPSIGGITFIEGSTDGSNILKLQGTFLKVNSCVVGLRYLPNRDFYGQDSLVVTANAIDEYTQQLTPLSSIQVAITVDAVNDAPVWNIGSSIVREIQQNQAASITGIYFYDVDIITINCAVNSCVMDLTVEASDGLAVLPGPLSSQFSNDMTTKKAAYTEMSGTPDELNLLLSRMTFELTDPEFYRADSPDHTDIKLQLTVDDRGTFGWGGPQISTTTVVFSPVEWSRYDFSIVAPEGVLALDEDTVFVFDGNLQLVDPDSARSFHNLLELTITCTNGTFALSSSATGVQILRNNSDEGVVIRGFFAQLNAALNGSSYIPVANWYGSEEISLSVVELNRLEKSKERAVASIFLFVAPVCDESRWDTLSSNALTMTEDEYLLIDTLSLTNPDLDDQREVLVTIDVKHGGVMLSMTRGLLIHEAVYSTSEDRLVAQHVMSEEIFSRSRLFFREMVFRGRVSDVNFALKGMVFQPWLDYNSDGWPVDEIVLTATSACSSTESSSSSASQITIPIGVDAVNDPPVLISQHFLPVSPPYSLNNLELASSIEAVEDLPHRLESTELYDPDFDLRSGDLRLLVNISCIHCMITSEYLSHSSDIQPSGDLIVVTQNWQNVEGVQLVVHGNLPALNNGLMNQLIFQGVDNFNGLAFVLVEISDLGNYGEGGEQRSVFALGVHVKAVNDKPQIYLPQYGSQEPGLQLYENSSVLIQGAPALSEVAVPDQRQTPEWNLDSMRSITLQDVEAMKNMEDLTVSLNCSKGWLSLGRHCDGVDVSLNGTPDNKKAAVLTLKGSLNALNCAIEKVTYHSKPQESGEDEIHVTLSQGLVTDRSVVDDTERDSSYTVSKRMLVEIQAINDPPSVSMATTFYAPMGEWVTLAGIEITDPDSADGILYVSVAVRSGRLRVTLPPRINSGGPTAIHPTVDGDTSQTLEFATTVEQAKQIFGALEYICDDANSQREYLTVQVDDNGFTGSREPQVAIMTAQIIVISEANV